MRREFISRLTSNRFKSKKDLRNIFETEKSDVRKRAREHASNVQLKGVHRGNFYRIKVPGPPPPSPVSRLLNPSSPPVKKFESSAASKHVHHAHSSGATKKKTPSAISEWREASREERREFFEEYWKRVQEWFKLNWPVLVLNFGVSWSLFLISL